jgi:hypothetical protein
MIFKIFSPKNLALFVDTTAIFCKKIDHNIGFWGNRQFFRRILATIAEISYHNIDPSLAIFFKFWRFFLNSGDFF